MKRFLHHIVCCLSAMLLAVPAVSANGSYGYTDDHPLVIVCDWDFQPFEFLSTDGDPAGYNIEVLDLILNRLGIPHRFVMQEWHAATQMFERREADLIHAPSLVYGRPPYMMTQKYINYYKLRAARRLDTPPLPHIRDLDRTDKLILRKDDYVTMSVQQLGRIPFQVEFLSPKEALTTIRSERGRYFIWGEIPLNRKVKELGLDSIALDEIDIPTAELHIIGYREDIVNIIDDEYTRLEQAGDLQKIYDKWFYPERVHDDTSPVALFILAGLCAVVALFFLLNRLTTLRVRVAVRKSGDLNSMMTQALGMGEYYVLEYDLQTGHIRNLYGNLIPPSGMQMDEFVSRVDASQQHDLLDHLDKMRQGKNSFWAVRRRWNAGTLEDPQWKDLYGKAITEDEHGSQRYIINIFKDITQAVADENRNQELASRYMRIFDTNLMAMSYYDSQGLLLDLNQKMRDLCQFSGEMEQFFRSISLGDMPIIKGDFDPTSHDPFHVCHRMFHPKQGLDRYIEFRINPIFDDDDRLVYYVTTCRDLTDERNMILQQREHDRKMQATNASISHYEQQLHYLLEESGMYVWNLDLQRRTIDFSRTLSKPEFSESLDEYIKSMDGQLHQRFLETFQQYIDQGLPFQIVRHFDHTPVDEKPVWYNISGMPLTDNQGRITHYFGLARNVTYLMEAQEQLRNETERAENSGRLKSAFLANMTHEIRTPLNAIVGFSSLLHTVDTVEERQEFIRIIRNNCDMLLRLINDILEASSMGQSMTIEAVPVDLAVAFNEICQTLSQRVQESGVSFIMDNPYVTYPATLDKGRLQQILTNFVTNAVKYTRQGHICVGYREEHRHGKPGLYFYCQDTGAGIPIEKQSAVFERFVKLNDFVQGTGLGLSICRAIIDRCHGDIGVSSEGEGHGSTFWFWIPTV